MEIYVNQICLFMYIFFHFKMVHAHMTCIAHRFFETKLEKRKIFDLALRMAHLMYISLDVIILEKLENQFHATREENKL